MEGFINQLASRKSHVAVSARGLGVDVQSASWIGTIWLRLLLRLVKVDYLASSFLRPASFSFSGLIAFSSSYRNIEVVDHFV